MSLVVDRRLPGAVALRDPAHLRARAVRLTGGALLVAALVLLILIERAGVPDAGRPDAGRVLLRVGPSATLLLLGALMLAHTPGHRIGRLITTVGLGGALAAAGSTYAIYSHFVHPLPAGEWAGWISEWSSAAIVLIPGVALLLFPDGEPPSARWRPAVWCGYAATALVALSGALGVGEDLEFQGNPLLPESTARAIGEPFGIGWFLMLIAMGAGIAAIVIRRRSAEGEVRDQLRLLLQAGLLVATGFLACTIGSLVAPAAFDAGAILAVGSLTILAAAMAVAILRHRLYGLDVFVDRALVLAGTSLVLGALYVAAVVGAGRLLGQDVQLGVALPATVLVAVAFQPVRDRLQRSVSRLLHGHRDEPYAAISTLGRRLGEAMAPDEVLPVMVATIADALRLPYVAVELADAPGSPAAAHGTPAAGIALRLPLVHTGERVGTLLIGARTHGDTLAAADRRLLEDFARRASAAASAVALSVEVQRSRERLVTAREEERRRIRSDLHDELGPTLAGAILTLDAARGVLARDPAAADALLDRAAESLEGTVADVRRLVYGLRPPALDQLGLVGALRQQAAALGPLTLELDAPDPMPPLPAAVEVAAFMIAREALTNVVRHAHAGRAHVSLAVGDRLRLEIRDDGCGLPEHPDAGVGLVSMRERAVELGGRFAIAAGRDGGTVVRVELPLAAG